MRVNARQIEEDRRQSRLWLIFSGIVVLILAVLAVVILRKNRELNLKNKIIFSQMQSLIKPQTKAEEQSDKTNDTASDPSLTDVKGTEGMSGVDNEEKEDDQETVQGCNCSCRPTPHSLEIF